MTNTQPRTEQPCLVKALCNPIIQIACIIFIGFCLIVFIAVIYKKISFYIKLYKKKLDKQGKEKTNNRKEKLNVNKVIVNTNVTQHQESRFAMVPDTLDSKDPVTLTSNNLSTLDHSNFMMTQESAEGRGGATSKTIAKDRLPPIFEHQVDVSPINIKNQQQQNGQSQKPKQQKKKGYQEYVDEIDEEDDEDEQNKGSQNNANLKYVVQQQQNQKLSKDRGLKENPLAELNKKLAKIAAQNDEAEIRNQDNQENQQFYSTNTMEIIQQQQSYEQNGIQECINQQIQHFPEQGGQEEYENNDDVNNNSQIYHDGENQGGSQIIHDDADGLEEAEGTVIEHSVMESGFDGNFYGLEGGMLYGNTSGSQQGTMRIVSELQTPAEGTFEDRVLKHLQPSVRKQSTRQQINDSVIEEQNQDEEQTGRGPDQQ